MLAALTAGTTATHPPPAEAETGYQEEDVRLVEEIRSTQPWLAPDPFGSLPSYEVELPAEAAAWTADALGTTEETAAAILRRQHAYYVAASVAQEVLGQEFVAASLDQAQQRIRVHVTGDPAEAEAQLRRIAAADRIQLAEFAQEIVVQQVLRGFPEIAQLYEAVSTAYPEIVSIGQAATISADYSAGLVIVRVARSPSEVAALLAPYGDAVTVVEDPAVAEGGQTACTRNDCLQDRVARGGMGVNGCTIGYVARSATGDSRYLLSANHCFANTAPNNQVYHAGSYVGYQSGGDDCCIADAGRIRVSGSGWTTANWLYHDLSAQRLQIEARISSTWCRQNCRGVAIYTGGRTTGLRPGSITNPWTTVAGRTQAFVASPIQCEGDSGGPTYTYPQAWAVGVGFWGLNGSAPDIGGQDCYQDNGSSHIQNAEDVADVTVLEN